MTGQSLKLGKFMTDIVANMFGHVGWLSIISTLQQTLSLSLSAWADVRFYISTISHDPFLRVTTFSLLTC